MENAQRINLLGALALALADAQAAATRRASGLGPSACAALVTLGATPGITIGALARVLGLSHSVTVRITEELVRAGLARRGAGADRREVALALTEAGASLRAAILAARAASLGDALKSLSSDDQARFGEMLATLLTGLTEGRQAADHICRLCDEHVCGLDLCPVERQAVRIAALRP